MKKKKKKKKKLKKKDLDLDFDFDFVFKANYICRQKPPVGAASVAEPKLIRTLVQ